MDINIGDEYIDNCGIAWEVYDKRGKTCFLSTLKHEIMTLVVTENVINNNLDKNGNRVFTKITEENLEHSNEK